ncbi:MAG: hypothetical protein IJU46_03900 [Clostridia bacterium]|nr:hypothetical protein [Clostridia bacterium]
MSEEKRKPVEGKYLMYRGKPLVREGNTICYGDMNDKYMLILDILNYKTVNGQQVPDSVMVQLVESANPSKCKNQSTKQGLSTAFNLGMVWLDLENRE